MGGCCGASSIDAAAAANTLQEQSPDILYPNEEIAFAFAFTRDQVYFTNIRILYKDKQGITGTRIGWRSIPYHIIKALSVQTAGTIDFDMELKVWASGVADIEVKFAKDGDTGTQQMYDLQRFITRRIFHADSVGKKKDEEPAAMPVQEAMSEDNMNKLFDLLGDDARAIDAGELEKQLKSCPPILDEDEKVHLAYRCGRDMTVLTNNRLLAIDVQGLSGKKVEYMSYFWKCIRAWSIATPGAFLDRDAEMTVWTNISGYSHRKFEQDLRKGVDIMAVQTFLTEKLLGHDSKPGSSHTASQPDEGAGWQALFGDQRMVDAGQANDQFHNKTPLLQGDELVEMAFKGMRDMMLFTTKRLVLIDPRGFTGTKVEYTSIPWKTVQAFGVQSAGSFLDKDSEMMIWTDIHHDPPPPKENEDDPPPPPLPGMAYIEQDFAKDKVDLATIGRYLAERCAPLGKEADQGYRPPQNLALQSDPGGFQKMLQVLGDDYRQVDPDELDRMLHSEAPLLLPNEKVIMGFACGRDKFLFTTHRAMKMDTQGFTGKRVQYLSVPYVNLRGFAVESSGSWDLDSQMELFFKAPWWYMSPGGDSFKIDFGKANADIVAIQNFLNAQVLGKADGTSALPPGMLPPCEQDMCGKFLNWLGDDNHQISTDEAKEKFLSDPNILLPDEDVELAFKCGRDLTVFTSKRLLLIDVKGWTGKRVSFVSTPWKYVCAFNVDNPGKFDLDGAVTMFTDSPGSGKTKMDIRAGQGDLKGCYQLLFKKTILDRQQVI
mmetsp:Transcript_45598/g.105807  ORF Transcript_45598/g.105807 Transcript_45598/m.105807 type:complete len:771 (-) Transcript_45598:103-2415(-)